MFVRQLKRPARPLPDLVARTEEALARHCGVLARKGLTAHLARLRDAETEPPKKSHFWSVQAWEPERAGAVQTASASQAEAGTEDAVPRRKQRVLFALKQSEIDGALGGTAESAGASDADPQTPSWTPTSSFPVSYSLSLALSAAQWRLETFRAGCRPPSCRPSGEPLPLPLM